MAEQGKWVYQERKTFWYRFVCFSRLWSSGKLEKFLLKELN